MGEVISAAGLLREIRERSPSIPLYVSVTTVAGRDIAEERLTRFGGRHLLRAHRLRSSPSGACWRAIRPSVVVILETEIWPVLVSRGQARRMQPAGRERPHFGPGVSALSPLAFLLSKTLLRRPDAILAQSEQDAARYLGTGRAGARGAMRSAI